MTLRHCQSPAYLPAIVAADQHSIFLAGLHEYGAAVSAVTPAGRIARGSQSFRIEAHVDFAAAHGEVIVPGFLHGDVRRKHLGSRQIQLLLAHAHRFRSIDANGSRQGGIIEILTPAIIGNTGLQIINAGCFGGVRVRCFHIVRSTQEPPGGIFHTLSLHQVYTCFGRSEGIHRPLIIIQFHRHVCTYLQRHGGSYGKRITLPILPVIPDHANIGHAGLQSNCPGFLCIVARLILNRVKAPAVGPLDVVLTGFCRDEENKAGLPAIQRDLHGFADCNFRNLAYRHTGRPGCSVVNIAAELCIIGDPGIQVDHLIISVGPEYPLALNKHIHSAVFICPIYPIQAALVRCEASVTGLVGLEFQCVLSVQLFNVYILYHRQQCIAAAQLPAGRAGEQAAILIAAYIGRRNKAPGRAGSAADIHPGNAIIGADLPLIAYGAIAHNGHRDCIAFTGCHIFGILQQSNVLITVPIHIAATVIHAFLGPGAVRYGVPGINFAASEPVTALRHIAGEYHHLPGARIGRTTQSIASNVCNARRD